MSDDLQKTIADLTEKLSGADLGGTIKLAVEGLGNLMIDGTQTPPTVAQGDDDADVTLSAELNTLMDMFSGSLDPTSAYMGGKLKVDGDMGLAMKLAQALA